MDTSTEAISTFHAAVAQLQSFAPSPKRPLGPNFGVAMAVLLHRQDASRYVISSPAGPATTTHDLQIEVCDPTWAKDSVFLPGGATGPIYKPFTNSFKGRSPSVNNWRNSFDIQGGIGCNAPYSPAYLQSANYISEHRFNCALRDKSDGRCGASPNSALCFNTTKRGSGVAAGTDTSARHRPKILQRGNDSTGEWGYWTIEPTLESMTDLLGDPTARVPALAFAVALLSGSPYWSQWGDDITVERLQSLLAMDDEMFLSVFDPSVPLTQAILGATTTSSTTAPSTPSTSHKTLYVEPMGAVDYVDRSTDIVIEIAGRESDPERRRQLLENATQGHRRILNVLAGSLRSAGFTVREQPGGYDLHARSEERNILFEAKTWTARNLASQVRSGWAQLEEYAYRSRADLGTDVELVLVFDREPPTDFWAWEWFQQKSTPVVMWVEEDELATFVHHASWLHGLIGGHDESATESA